MLNAEPIARGTTADIYTWDAGRVLKLFHAAIPREHVAYEARLGRIVTDAGIAAPHVFEVVEQAGRYGIIYEYIEGMSLNTLIRPWNARQLGRTMAAQHLTLFAQVVPALPRQRDRLLERVASAPYLSPLQRDKQLAVLASLPDSDVLCHGDFHPANVIQTPTSLKIIDWTDATQGHPVADMARTVLILEEVCAFPAQLVREVVDDTAPLPAWVRQGMGRALVGTVWLFLNGYRGEMMRLLPDAALIPRWLPVLAAARLHEGQYREPTSALTQRMLRLARC